MRLTPEQRLALIDHINALVQVDFERLVFALDAPRSVVPSNYAAQGDRAAALLAWVKSPVGCGMEQLLKSLGSIAPLPSILSPSRLDGSVVSPSQRQTPLSAGANGVQIFLAHAKEDEAQVMELYERLQARGYRPWLDKKDLLPGQNWRKAITRAISQSDIFVACLSSRSVRKQGYVQQEFRLALNVLAQKPPDTIYLIPLRLDDCEIPDLRQSEYGVNMRDYQWLNYYEADGYERLERALSYQSGQGLGVSSSSFADAPRSVASPFVQPSAPSIRPPAVPKPVSPPSSSPSARVPIGKPMVNGANVPARSPQSKLRPSSSQSRKRSVGSNPSSPGLPSFSIPLSRRRMLQVLGFTGGSAGVWWLGGRFWRSPDPWITWSESSEWSQEQWKSWSESEEVLSALELLEPQPFTFGVVTVDVQGREVDRKSETRERIIQSLDKDVTLDLVKIPGNTFRMGSPLEKEGLFGREGPQRDVVIQEFWMGRYPVTQEQWRIVASSLSKVERELEPEPSSFKGDRRPVESVSWLDAQEFCDRLSKQTGRVYRLPTEAEWEYACRAGTITPFHFGETITPKLANYNGNFAYDQGPKGEYRGETTPVDQFNVANAFGLSDMHGNVWEWCQDHWHENYEGAPTDGSAWIEGGNSDFRILRGGSWPYDPGHCRSAYRDFNAPDDLSYLLGFRVVLAPR